MINIVDSIHVLKLKKNPREEIEQQIRKIYPVLDISWHEVEGSKQIKNEGNINLSLWKIMEHNWINEISKDITMNHISMIKDAYMNNSQFALFLEEDCVFENIHKKISEVNQWLYHKTKKWDIFFLGYVNWPLPCSMLVTSQIVKIYTPLCAHAYILNKKGMEKILNFTEYGKHNMNMHIDKMYQIIPNFRKYAIFPMVAYQKKEPALLQKAMDKINMKINFKTLCYYNERLSIILPILCLFLLVYILYRIFKPFHI